MTESKRQRLISANINPYLHPSSPEFILPVAVKEKRRHPREAVSSEQRVVRITPAQKIEKDIVFSRDLSASGISFESKKPLDVGNEFLLYIPEKLLEDLDENRASVLKLGGYIMARVVWQKNELIGSSFLDRREGNFSRMDLFTRLVNADCVDRM